MSDFDPYLEWLGIREQGHPINHYRLLGLELYEDDPEVISMAADRQMTHIRSYQNGPHGDVSQEILNELARARRCLLDVEKKTAYDDQLKSQLSRPLTATDARATPSSSSRAPLAQPIERRNSSESSVPVVPPTLVPTASEIDSAMAAAADPVDPVGLKIRASNNVRAKTKMRESKQMWWSLLGWVSGGLAAVGIGAALIGSGWISRGGSSASLDSDSAEPAKGDSISGDSPSLADRADVDGVSGSAGPAANRRLRNSRPSVETPSLPNKLFLPDPAESQFDSSNLGSYPKSSPDTFGLFGDVKQSMDEKQTVLLESSSFVKRQPLRCTPESGAVMIGMVITTQRNRTLASVQPIFHDGFRAFPGDLIGAQKNSAAGARLMEPELSIARPGYAVGEIEVSAVRPVKCLRIRYMKIGNRLLDPADSYVSKWFGDETGPYRVLRNPAGVPVVGVVASLGRPGLLATIGLVGVDPDGELASRPVNRQMAKRLPQSAQVGPSKPTDGVDPDPFAPDPLNETPLKVPAPDARARSAARKRIPESILATIEDAGTIAEKIRASRRLVAEAGTRPNKSESFVILMQANALGVAAGDAFSAVAAIRAIDQDFEIDFWNDAFETVDKASRNLNAETAVDFKDTLDGLIEEARSDSQFDAAGRFLSLAIRLSRIARDVGSTNEYLQMERRFDAMDELFKSNEKAVAALAVDPRDKRANRDRGDYLFVCEQNPDEAVNHWALSQDAKRVEIAKLSARMTQPSGAQVVELADAWWRLGKSNRSLLDQRSLERAENLYRQASRRVPAEEKSDVLQKLEKLKLLLGN